MKGGYFLNSGILFDTAVSAYQRLVPAPSDKAGGQNDALVAVLFSAATLEAFVPELALMAQSDSALFGDKRLQSVAGVLDEAEASRGSVRLKFILAKSILSGETYDKGQEPYQDFDALIALRDAIIHMKPEQITGEPHKLLQRLRAKDLCEDGQPNLTASWLGQISTRAVARWACNTVVEMVESLMACLPPKAGQAPLMATLFAGRYKRVD
jgi:hypothetical protein